MKQEIKIVLPFYKVAYSAIFPLLLCLVRGISATNEIGVALDDNLGLLAIVFCAETWVMEQSGKRWEIFALYPSQNRNRTVRRRLFWQLAYLCPISYVSYFFFYWQSPRISMEKPFWWFYGIYLIAVTVTVLFWGTLSMTISNLFRSQWAGIGGGVILWLLVNSTGGNKYLGNLNIFAYGFRDLRYPDDFGWLWGKAAGLALTAVMLGMSSWILKKRG